MKKNRLRELMNEGKPILGTCMITVEPWIAEVIGKSGVFDYIELTFENASWSLPDMDNLARAIELYPHMSAMIKVEQEPRRFIAGRAVDAGIQNLLFADCRSAEDVRECIRSIMPETPEDGGVHGCADMRRGVFGTSTKEWVQAQKDAVIAIMLEKKSAMEELDEILEIERLDVVQFGPTDYSITLGQQDEWTDADTERIQRDVIEKVLKKGKQSRVRVNTPAEMREYLDMGVRHFIFGWDLIVIDQWCRAEGQALRNVLNAISEEQWLEAKG